MTNHKFIDQLNSLEAHPITGCYHILVVGTFNADVKGNVANWFYGRPENEFWCLMPRMMNAPSLHPVDRDEDLQALKSVWVDYCNEKRIVIVDIFKSIDKVLENHSDKELEDLKEGEYIPFDFKKALANAKFDAVLFTWKSQTKSCIGLIKQEFVDFFASENCKIMHMLTPSNTYAKPRIFKLKAWKEEYNAF